MTDTEILDWLELDLRNRHFGSRVGRRQDIAFHRVYITVGHPQIPLDVEIPPMRPLRVLLAEAIHASRKYIEADRDAIKVAEVERALRS